MANSDINGFPRSGMPVLKDDGDRICLGTIYDRPLKQSGFIVDVIGASRLLGALTIGGALTGATSGAFSAGVTMTTLTATTGAFSGAVTITQASGVTALTLATGSSLAMTGSIGSVLFRPIKIWAENLDVVNMPTVDGRSILGIIQSTPFSNLTTQVGASTGTATSIGKASVNTTEVGNVGGGTDDLMTYSLPLDSLSAAGKGIHITAWGTTANNANAKTLTLNFGSVAVLTHALTASIAGVWRIEADIFSTGTDAQTYISQLVTTGTAGAAVNDVEQGTATENDGAAITIKCTGAATSDNDIVQKGLLITFLN